MGFFWYKAYVYEATSSYHTQFQVILTKLQQKGIQNYWILEPVAIKTTTEYWVLPLPLTTTEDYH